MAYFSDDHVLYAKMSSLLEDLCSEFGSKARRVADLAGTLVLEQIMEEEHRLKQGVTCEPPTFYEKNNEGRGI